MLGSHIGGFADRADQAMNRGDIDDAAPAALAHAGQGEAGTVEHRGQVDRDNRVPPLDRELFDAGHVLNARVVDQNVDAAEFAFGVVDHVGDLRRVADIGRVMPHLAAKLLQFGNDFAGVAKTVEYQVGASLGQALRDTQTNTAGGTGNQGGFTFQAHDQFLR